MSNAKATHANNESKRKAAIRKALAAKPGPIRLPQKPVKPVNFPTLEAKALEAMSGTPPPAVPPIRFPTNYNVPLGNGGPIALLMVANLDAEEGFKSLVRALQGMQPRDDADRATVEQLKLAQEMGRALSVAVIEGKDSPLWKCMGSALKTILGTGRVAVVKNLEELLHYKRGTDLLKASPNPVDSPAMSLDAEIARVLKALAGVAPAFVAVTKDELRNLIEGKGSAHNIGVIGMAVKLSRQCGAFGDQKRTAKNVRQAYEAAMKMKAGSEKAAT